MNDIYFAFDTETGGLEPESFDLLTFYAAILDNKFNILEELDLKLKPNDGRLPVTSAEALRVNGINIKEHLENPLTVTYQEGHDKLDALIHKFLKKRGRYSNIRPIGQNVQFDIDYTQHYLYPKKEWNNVIHYGKIDTKLCVDFLKDSGWFPPDIGNLGSVVDYLGIPKRNAHTAKDDTLMCVDVYKKLLEIMASKKEGGQVQDLISLLEAE